MPLAQLCDTALYPVSCRMLGNHECNRLVLRDSAVTGGCVYRNRTERCLQKLKFKYAVEEMNCE